MIYFLIGLFIGGVVGFTSGALMHIVTNGDYDIGFKDGMRAQALHEELCQEEREDDKK